MPGKDLNMIYPSSGTSTQRDDRRNQLIRDLEQIDGYLARLGLGAGWLVIFDRRRDVSPIEERLRSELHHSEQGREITVIFA